MDKESYEVFPLAPLKVVGLILLIGSFVMANLAGTAGGSWYISILMICFSFEIPYGSAISNSLIAVCGILRFIATISKLTLPFYAVMHLLKSKH